MGIFCRLLVVLLFFYIWFVGPVWIGLVVSGKIKLWEGHLYSFLHHIWLAIFALLTVEFCRFLGCLLSFAGASEPTQETERSGDGASENKTKNNKNQMTSVSAKVTLREAGPEMKMIKHHDHWWGCECGECRKSERLFIIHS